MSESRHPIESGDRHRLLIVGVGVFFLLSLLIVQFYRVQVLQHEHWAARAENQHYFTIAEPFKRGRFFSNAGIKQGHPEKDQPLVIDLQKYHLHVDSQSIPAEVHSEVTEKLVGFLQPQNVSSEHILTQLEKRNSRNRRVAMWVDRDQRQEVLDWWFPFAREHHIVRNALFFLKDYQRSYPYGKLLGQALHTIQDTKDELTKQARPTGGLESQFNSYLQGKLGKRRLLRSPRNAMATGEVIDEPEDGADVYLTINHILQAIAEEELERGVLSAEAKAGWAVMMDPFSGEILALAQYPFFYPASYRDYFNDADRIEDTKVKAITDAYEPGSVMKPVTLAVALAANAERARTGKPPLFNPEEKIPTLDGRFPGRRSPIRDTKEHRYLNMYMGLQHSSNIYMGRIVHRVVESMGNSWYRDALSNDFGFGNRTGIELPGESPGILPRPGRLHANGQLEWSLPTPYSLAMGYNLQVNSLQMLRAWAVIANGGRLVRPTLVKRVVKTGSESENILLDNTVASLVPRSVQVLDPEICAEVVKAMKYVTKGAGSARRGNVPGYTEAGKTGTSRKLVNGQYSKRHYLASFIGFTPIKDPRFLLYVVIDEPKVTATGNHYGGKSAAPIYSAIARRSLEYLGVAPDDPFGYPRGHPQHDPDRADWSEENRRLQEKYEEWNGT